MLFRSKKTTLSVKHCKYFGLVSSQCVRSSAYTESWLQVLRRNHDLRVHELVSYSTFQTRRQTWSRVYEHRGTQCKTIYWTMTVWTQADKHADKHTNWTYDRAKLNSVSSIIEFWIFTGAMLCVSALFVVAKFLSVTTWHCV